MGLLRLAVRARALSMAENDQGVEYAVQKSDAEWREGLSDMEYQVLRLKGTERPGTGEYNKYYPTEGHFVCAAPSCAQPLYSAQAKFDSGCGWPAFDKIVKGAVVTQTDNTLGMKRVEILCSGCGGHLGHVFEGEGFTPTMERHCVNSVSVKYVEGAPAEPLEEAKVSNGEGGGGTFGRLVFPLVALLAAYTLSEVMGKIMDKECGSRVSPVWCRDVVSVLISDDTPSLICELSAGC